MRKFFKYSGICSAFLAVLTFIFMMAFSALAFKDGDTTYLVPGARVIFGETVHGALVDTVYKAAPVALVAWILVLVAMVILLAGVILPLLKVKALDKVAGVLNLVAVVALVLAGVLLFFTKGSYNNANALVVGSSKTTLYDNYHLTFGYILAAILAILGGAVAICPAVADFLGKKKRK